MLAVKIQLVDADVAEWVECLPGMHKALTSSPAPHKNGKVVHACNAHTWEVETGGPEIQGHL